ncbi:MAG TPA: radical SAM protein [Negativicutes bacterium]|nr:radical SAM protein [Negativicutes bacterium]
MLLEINEGNLTEIANPKFREYAQIYSKIYGRFLEHINTDGLELDSCISTNNTEQKVRLTENKVKHRNNNHSIHVNWISPACKACNKGQNSATFYLSLQCHRHCYYCFNPNQQDYDEHTAQQRDSIKELDQLKQAGGKLDYIALTGGEPLLHPEATVRFFQAAKLNFRRAHTRLYTSGDLLDKAILDKLEQARLDEIRFSIKLEDSLQIRRKVMEMIRMAKDIIPCVMVEMPVIPGTLPEMKELLQELNTMGIAGINLLEFCFPYHNAQEFKKRLFRVKNPPFEVLYDYWYAGGLPIAGSEDESLELLNFAVEEALSMGVHYCSLENKFTGQVFQQNQLADQSKLIYLSPKDYFIKTAKVFGEDIPKVIKVFETANMREYEINTEYQYLEFPVEEIHVLTGLSVEIGISTNIMEVRQGDVYRRELKIERVLPQEFHRSMV